MIETRARYIVKGFNDGMFGVYDTENGSYPIQTPELRAVGVERCDFTTDKDRLLGIADLLNGAKGAFVVLSEAAAKAEESLQAMGKALIEAEAAARG